MSIGETFPYQPGDLNRDGNQNWGALERAVLTSLIETVEQAVTVDGLDVNGDLTVQGHGIINAAFIQFILSGDGGLLRQQWVDSNGDLWYRDGSNRTVQVTSGGALAVGASTGGFAGDYISTNPSGASYDNSTGKFSFTAPSPSGQSAIINGGPIQLRQGADTDYVGLAVPASLPGTYTLTFPSTLPAGQQSIVVCDITGGLNYRLSASFTESIDVSAGSFCSNLVMPPQGEGSLNNGIPVGPFTGSVRLGYELPVRYQYGDRIDAVSFGTLGTGTTTGTLYHRGDGGATAVIARKAFNGGGAGLKTMSAGAATMTGTLPFTPPNTGSLTLRVEFGPQSGVTDALHTAQVVGMRKLIS